MGGGAGGGGNGGRKGGGGGSTNGDDGQPGEVVRQATLEKLRTGKLNDDGASTLQYQLEQKADHARFIGDAAGQKQYLAEARAVQTARDQAWKEKSAKMGPLGKITVKQGGPSVRNDDNAGGRRDLTSDFAKRMAKERKSGR